MSDPIVVMGPQELRVFLRGGCARLGSKQEEVNALNVFPVPDGDTGVNMYLTVASGEKKMLAAAEGSSLGRLAADFSMGTLMGARGNSGVILSQIFRGISLALQNQEQADAAAFAAALQKGVDLSYKSVMKPVEGTILTVFRLFAAACAEEAARGAGLEQMLQFGLAAGEKALADTPRLLPVLKEAGVVDAGGQGLLVFMQGALDGLTGRVTETRIAAPSLPVEQSAVPANARDDISTADIKYTYCTQLLITGEGIPVDEIREHLSHTPPGDSLLVVGDENLVKIHFHNNEPAQVLAYCSRFGALHDIIVDDMREQHHDNMAAAYEASQARGKQEEPAAVEEGELPETACGVVAVAAGSGMAQIYHELGACVISGGQTMNPSAEDILNAIDQCPAPQVVILPNNSNIVMSAEQAVSLSKKPAAVVRTKYVAQGLGAMLGFDPDGTAADNAEAMLEACAGQVNGELTFAVRDTCINGLEIREGDLLAVGPEGILGCGADIETVLPDLAEQLVALKEGPELVSLYYGNDLSEERAEALTELVRQRLGDDIEVECYFGGQPLYYFLIAVE
ncbi:MAG: DAK2 domain-containing protein [Firmicutes bacterium]|nr:DAK2 domain-containing protein [Bacillota bacterium]